jgi:hypothetical protein
MPLLEGSHRFIFKEDAMRNVSKLLLAFSLVCLITACPAQTTSPSLGKLEVKISGLPSGTNASVSVTGPASFNQALTVTKTLTGLTAGSYVVVAANVMAGGTFGATVTGSPANVTDGKTSSVSVVYGALRTITGKLVNGAGQPITAANIASLSANLSVKLPGAGGNAVIDANGNFTLTDVPATYSLLVSVSVSGSHFVDVFQGLTRANPTLTVSQGPFSSPSPVQGSNSPLEGKITGGSGFPTPSSTSTVFTVAVPKAVSYFSTVDASTGTYSTGLGWSGSNSVTAIVHALQFSTDANGKIAGYSGYGRQEVTLAPQGPSDPGQPLPIPVKQNVALAAVAAGSVKGAITWPPGLKTPEYQITTNLLFAGPDQTDLNLSSPIGFSQPPVLGTTSSYDQLVPLITGTKFIQRLSINEKVTSGSFPQGGQSTVWKSVTPGMNTDINVPAPIGLKLPEENATDVSTSTKFSWSAYTGGIHIVNFYPFPGAGTGQTLVRVITAESSTTLPGLGDVIPKGAFVLWGVQGIVPYSSLDAATDTNGGCSREMGLPLEGLCKKARVGEGEIQRGPKISSQSGFSPTFPLPTICTDRLQQLAGKRLKGSKLQIVLSHSSFRPRSQTAAAPD